MEPPTEETLAALRVLLDGLAPEQPGDAAALAGAALELVPGQLWLLDEQLGAVYFNRAARAHLALAEFPGRRWLDGVHAEDRESLRAAMREARAGPGGFAVECRLLRAGGQHGWFRVAGEPLLDRAGRILGFVAMSTDVGAARETGAALREFEISLDAMLDGVYINDAETLRYFYVNEGAVRYTGYTREELLMMSTADLNPDISPAAVHEFTDRIVRGEQQDFRRTGHHRHKDGHLIPIESVTQLVQLPGRRTSLVTVTRDLTERLRAEAAVRRLASTLDATRDGVFLYEADTLQFFYVNAGACAYTGYSERELLEKKAWELNPEIDESAVHGFFADLVAGRVASTTRTGFHERKDGTLVPVEVVTQYVEVPGERPTFVSISRDITARLQHEAEIHRLRTSLENVRDGVFIYDPETLRFDYVNQGAADYLGYTVAELRSMSVPEINADWDNGAMARLLDDLRQGRRGAARVEVRHRRRDGVTVPVELAVNHVAPPGEPPRIITIARDISDRVAAREAQAAQRRELERLVAERTRELEQAQDELLKQERLSTLGQLTATVSHELRNPLGTITPSLFVLRKLLGEDNARVTQILERIERSVRRCDRIIDELLDFTRHRALELSGTDANCMLEACLDDVIIPAGVELRTALLDRPVSVAVEVESLRRALLNVVDNAFHAVVERRDESSDDYTPLVTVSLRADGGDEVRIVVEDNGPGIPQEAYENLFEPLFSTKSYGIGLGMTIVNNIMRQHHGRVHVDSEDGVGTRVSLCLPVAGSRAAAGLK